MSTAPREAKQSWQKAYAKHPVHTIAISTRKSNWNRANEICVTRRSSLNLPLSRAYRTILGRLCACAYVTSSRRCGSSGPCASREIHREAGTSTNVDKSPKSCPSSHRHCYLYETAYEQTVHVPAVIYILSCVRYPVMYQRIKSVFASECSREHVLERTWCHTETRV